MNVGCFTYVETTHSAEEIHQIRRPFLLDLDELFQQLFIHGFVSLSEIRARSQPFTPVALEFLDELIICHARQIFVFEEILQFLASTVWDNVHIELGNNSLVKTNHIMSKCYAKYLIIPNSTSKIGPMPTSLEDVERF